MLETTGPSAIAAFGGRGLELSSLIYMPKRISPQAENIHGVTQEELKAAPGFPRVFAAFLEALDVARARQARGGVIDEVKCCY